MNDASMLSQLLFSNSQYALDLTKGLVNAEGGPLINSKLGKSQLEQKQVSSVQIIPVNISEAVRIQILLGFGMCLFHR